MGAGGVVLGVFICFDCSATSKGKTSESVESVYSCSSRKH